MREVPGYAAMFAFYEQLKGYFVSADHPHLTMVEAMLIAPLPAIIGWFVAYPQDVVKTLIQVNPRGHYKPHKWIPD